jgi:hypothetical protein
MLLFKSELLHGQCPHRCREGIFALRSSLTEK